MGFRWGRDGILRRGIMTYRSELLFLWSMAVENAKGN